MLFKMQQLIDWGTFPDGYLGNAYQILDYVEINHFFSNCHFHNTGTLYMSFTQVQTP